MRGHIRKRGKSWQAILYLGKDAVGKKRYRSMSFATRREAEEWLASMVSQPGLARIPSRVRFAEFACKWLDSHAPGRLGPKTLYEYRRILENRLIPAFGHLPLSRIGPAHIAEFCAREQASGKSSTTVLHAYRLLREILGFAVRWGVLQRNPAELVDPPRRRRNDVRVWDEEQARLFLAAARQSPLYPLYLTALLTGMRQSELLGLKWEDVDMVTGTAVVRQTLYRLGSSVIVKEPKSGKARSVLLPPAVVEVLRVHRSAQESLRRQLEVCPHGLDCRDGACPYWHEAGLVFTQPNGKPLHANNITKRDFRRVIEQAGLPRIRFHDLRHVHATLLLKSGVNLKAIQERLGHSTAAFTLQVYGHLLPGLQREAAEAAQDLGLTEIDKSELVRGSPGGGGRLKYPQQLDSTGAPGGTRTPDLQVRSLPLSPPELRARHLDGIPSPEACQLPS